MSSLSVSDLVVYPGQGEKTDADMVMIFRPQRLDGHFSIMEGEVRPNELLAFHTHANEDQHMYIISGELHFEVGGADGLRFVAGAGSHVIKPRGTSHGFWNLGEETARYVETSTGDGFEQFIDGRKAGVGSMVGAATAELGMSFEVDRALEVLKEFQLTGLAGVNLPSPKELVKDPGFRRMMTESPTARELFFYLGGTQLREMAARLF